MEVQQPRKYRRNIHPTGRRGRDGQPADRTHGKVVAGGPSEVADCGGGQAKLQLATRQQLVDPATDWQPRAPAQGN